MCMPVLAPNPTPVQIAIHDLRVAEGGLTRMTIERHKQKWLDPIIHQAANDLRRVFREEQDRILDLLGTVRLAHVKELGTAEIITDPDELLRLLRIGITDTEYQAILERLYLRTFDPAVRQTVVELAWGRRRRIRPDQVRIAGLPNVRRWMRDNAIQFSRKYAPEVTAKTNEIIRRQMVEGFSLGEGNDQLAARIREVYKASARTVGGNLPEPGVQDRAGLIARTQGSRGWGEARIQTAREVGIYKKHWILSGSIYSLTDICSDNADMGEIGIEENFAHGGLSEPAHPCCECNTALVPSENWDFPDETIAALD